MQEQYLNYNPPIDELDEEQSFDIKKIIFLLWQRKMLIIKVFLAVLIFMIVSTFFIPKKYVVDSDLYINKSNNSNMAEFNPYFISEIGTSGGLSSMMAGNSNLTNELELMQSPLVIDKVIKENDLRFKKLFGIIPTVKTGQLLTTEKFLKKKVSFKIKKDSTIVTISYKDKDKELAYGVVSSIVRNYILLHKEINTEKSKSDKQLLEKEYNKAKSELEKKVKSVQGLPSTAMTGAGNLSAMSAFSSSAQRAMSNIQGQYVAGEKSQLAVKEDAEKVAHLASKLEWAKLVDEMSDSSKVLVIKEPRHLKEYEQSSPKLLINIILGIILGVIAALFAVTYKEITDKKLSYSMLGDDIIYDIGKDFISLKVDLLTNENKKIAFILYEKLPENIKNLLNEYNIAYINPDLTSEFLLKAQNAYALYNIVSINKTDATLYKQIKNIFNKMNMKNIKDVIIKE